MALRNQPYFPLYVMDYTTDEKLIQCSASTQGVYIRLLCLFHKSDEYGGILLKQKNKQNESNVENFVCILSKILPFDFNTVADAIVELLDEKVLSIEGDFLFQRRMVKDNRISIARSEAGKSGGGNPNLNKQKSKQKNKQKSKQITENEDVSENEDDFKNKGETEKQKILELEYPFNSDQFIEVWKNWKVYKYELKNSKFKYTSVQSEQAALVKLAKLSGGDEPTAIEIITESMSNGWSGFFELKNNTKNGSNKPATGGAVDTRSAFGKIDRMFGNVGK